MCSFKPEFKLHKLQLYKSCVKLYLGSASSPSNLMQFCSWTNLLGPCGHLRDQTLPFRTFYWVHFFCWKKLLYILSTLYSSVITSYCSIIAVMVIVQL